MNSQDAPPPTPFGDAPPPPSSGDPVSTATAPPPPPAPAAAAAQPPAAPDDAVSPTADPADASTGPGDAPIEPGTTAPPKARLPLAARIWLIVLSVLVAGALAGLAFVIVQLLESQRLIEQQREQITELDELVETKEEFGTAMNELMDVVESLDGAPMAALVPFHDYERLAERAWRDRRSAPEVASHAGTAVTYRNALERTIELADEQRSTNASGTYAEEVLDKASSGFAELVYDDVDKLCEKDVLGCVVGYDPFVVHLDKKDLAHPSFDRWAERYLTLHEYAHVLQFTNPEATAKAGKAFDDDWEVMADCYALHTMDSWSLDRRVWVSSFEYWDVTYGYGRVCDAGERKVIDSWMDEIGVVHRAISQ